MPEWLQKIANSQSKTFLAFCFCFIAGAGIFSFANSGKLFFILYLLLFSTLFLLILLWSRNKQRFLLLCLLVFVLGGLRLLITIPNHNSSRIEFYNGNKVSLQGWISAEPNIGISDARYVVSVLCKGKPCEKVNGKIIIKTLLYPQYNYGDKLEINCSLQEPENFTDSNFNYIDPHIISFTQKSSGKPVASFTHFDYQKYLAKQDVWSVCLNPKVVSLGENRGNFLFKIMFRMKSAIQNQMARLWPEPANSLLAGVLYGGRSGLPQDLADNFTRTGVSHIVAVSGYNVSIIVMILNICLIYLGLSRRQSFWFLNFLILSFVFFSGATASVVRAGVMAVIILFTQQVGRLSVAGRTLVYAAVIMLLFNPYLLIWDAGFQLSFLSTLGLVYLSPVLENILLKKIKMRRFQWLAPLAEVLITTLSAIAATLPLILFQFGRLSLVAPLVNVLVLWLVPWLMLFGFVALLLSWLFFPLGQMVAWVAGLGLNYVIIIVDWFGNKSWSALDMRIPVWLMLGLYLFLMFYVIKHLYGQKS